jgi:hypothetical protein
MRYLLTSARTIAQGQKRQTLEAVDAPCRYSTTTLSISFAEAILPCDRRWSQENRGPVYFVALGRVAKVPIAMGTLATRR